jgi:hypothetical protein
MIIAIAVVIQSGAVVLSAGELEGVGGGSSGDGSLAEGVIDVLDLQCSVSVGDAQRGTQAIRQEPVVDRPFRATNDFVKAQVG